MNNKYLYLVKNIGIFTISNFATKFLTFLIVPFYTYYLSTEQYATIDLINTTVSLFLPIFTICISDSLLRFTISNISDSEQIYSISVNITIIGGISLIILSPILKYFNFLENYVNQFIVIFILNSFLNIFSNYARAVNKIKCVMVGSIINTLTLLTLNVFFIGFFKLGTNGYLAAMIISLFVTNLVYVYTVKPPKIKFIPYKKLFKEKMSKKMLKYSLPLIPNSIFWWINSALDRYCLNILIDLSSVGIYSVANKIPSILSVFISIFSQAWNLSAFKEYDDKDYNFFNKVFKLFLSSMVILSTLLILFTKVLATILFQKEFFIAWKIVPILIITFFINSLNVYLGSLYTASKETKGLFTTTFIGAICNMILNFLFITFFGITGAAIATCTSNLVVFLFRYIFTKKKFNLKINIAFISISIILLSIQSCFLTFNYLVLNISVCVVLVLLSLFHLFKKQ